jgi:hypothetical protein
MEKAITLGQSPERSGLLTLAVVLNHTGVCSTLHTLKASLNFNIVDAPSTFNIYVEHCIAGMYKNRL